VIRGRRIAERRRRAARARAPARPRRSSTSTARRPGPHGDDQPARVRCAARSAASTRLGMHDLGEPRAASPTRGPVRNSSSAASRRSRSRTAGTLRNDAKTASPSARCPWRVYDHFGARPQRPRRRSVGTPRRRRRRRSRRRRSRSARVAAWRRPPR
jgi:hypothetical protein